MLLLTISVYLTIKSNGILKSQLALYSEQIQADHPVFFVGDIREIPSNNNGITDIYFQLQNNGRQLATIDSMLLVAFNTKYDYFNYNKTYGPTELVGDILSQPQISLNALVARDPGTLYYLRIYYHDVNKHPVINHQYCSWESDQNGKFYNCAIHPKQMKGFLTKIEIQSKLSSNFK